MEKLLTLRCSQELWFGILISSALCFVFLCFDYSTFLGVYSGVHILVNNKQPNPITILKTTRGSCSDQYIYIHDRLPARFNADFLSNCEALSPGTSISNIPSMCPHLVNLGLGPKIDNFDGILTNQSWFKTNPYLLELIFHNKMKKYDCLTNNFSLASAIYVPFYPSMDVGVHLWDSNLTVRDASAKDFVKWVSDQPEWAKMWGRDHFFASGRIAWDFRRERDNSSNWGSKLRFFPESLNMTMLTLEGSRWKNDIAIPYPTNFHPSSDIELVQWQNKVRQQKRPNLFTFVGAPRPNQATSIRGKLIERCQASTNCMFLHCGENNCDNPVTVMTAFQSSVYCLQPPGDSYTRRSAFDAILAGCIPVFFHPATAYTQYLWYLPMNRTKYSVFIPVRDIKDLTPGRIEKVLVGMSKERELAMREEVIGLIPKLVYADPRSRLEETEDAFDIAVRGILERVENVRKVIGEGKDPSIGFADEDNSKFHFPSRDTP